jgi:hypothetical protein
VAFQHVGGLDHVVIMVADLDRAAEDWRNLGFTVSPKGIHSPHVGAANHTVVLGNDYIELLTVLRETPQNAPSRAFLKQHGDGIERIALVSGDVAAAVTELQAAKIEATGPFSFGRPVPGADGDDTEARFRIARWPVADAPGGARLFVCEHETPEVVWQPSLQVHPNTATRVLTVEMATPDPAQEADDAARLIGRMVLDSSDGLLSVPTGEGRATLVFGTRRAFQHRYPRIAVTDLPERGAAAMRIGVNDLDSATAALGGEAHRKGEVLYLAADRATGTVVAFQAA